MKKFKKIFTPALFFLLVVAFFWQFFFKGLLPIPSDTIVGLYYPFRDIYSTTNPNGVPFKNFLTTDPVRQQYPWKTLAVNQVKEGNVPSWNPYNFTGTPLLANFQSSVFYPLSFLFFIMPFDIAWSVLIFLQPLLAGLFLYFYLRHLKLSELSSFLGSITFSFCGFSVSWLEWGTIGNTVLWLPLILLSVDKLLENKKCFSRSMLIWAIVLLFSLSSSLFAGHLQSFFYLICFSVIYLMARLLGRKNILKKIISFIILFILFVGATFIQWFPTLKFINLSARSVDLVWFQEIGWFIPWQHLIQFLAPDFFGNPTTLNYYGIWNYGEFIGYVGIISLTFALYALFFRKDKKTLFFGSIFFLSLIFALPTVFAKIPFKFNLPFLSTSQPTRLLFLTDFCLSILAALGFDYFVKTKEKKNILYILATIFVIFLGLWLFVIFSNGAIINAENILVAKQNLILPTLIFTASLVLFAVLIFLKNKKIINLALILLLLLVIFDLFRFGWKFEPFTKKEYLFPSTKVTSFLQKQEGPFRVVSSDSTILPPNFSIMYGIQTLDGYDPLYLKRYGELMAAVGREKPDISAPFGFNRIITPQNVTSRFIDLLNVKYVLSSRELDNPKFSLVFEDVNTKVYENTKVLPRAFFAIDTKLTGSKENTIKELFNINNPLEKTAIVEGISDRSIFKSNWDLGKVEFVSYEENKVTLKTENNGDGFLVLTDSYYPTWKATIDGKETEIFLTDYNFRGIIVPRGEHNIEFTNSLF